MSTRETIKLRNATLRRLDPAVQIPAYDRGLLLQHTVHLGVGGFHRAHQAVYLDDLLALPNTERWGECGLGVLVSDDRMRDALQSQDCLYTVVERSAQAQTARVIGSLVDFVYAPGYREAAIEKMAAAETRIVSLTITEGGYFLDEGSGKFMSGHPDIQHDLQSPHAPVSSMGLMVEALDRRRQRGLGPFTVMSCDNLQGNGHVVQRVLLEFAGFRDPGLERWLAEYARFPNSMVDRITPATKPADVSFVAERFRLDDAWPVVTEPFRQWVIEDEFCSGRPQWERVGAQIVADVGPYEIMKMRLLNGSHLAMAYLGALAGFTFVHEIMSDSLFVSLIERFMKEVTPVVPVIAGVSVNDYKKSLLHRFPIPTINDQVIRICSEGSAKIPKWLLPSLSDLLQQNAPIALLCFVTASWIVYLSREVDDRAVPLEIIDARAPELIPYARRSQVDPVPFFSVPSLFGESLPQQHQFVQGVRNAVESISTKGIGTAIADVLRAGR